MHPKLMAVLSAVNAGVLGALTVAIGGGALKLVALSFGLQFCKSLQDIFTMPPGAGNGKGEAPNGSS